MCIRDRFNRWIKATNAVIRDIKKKITLLFDWIAEAKAELAKPQAPDLVSLLNAYYTQRKAGAYSQKGQISNLKEMNDTLDVYKRKAAYCRQVYDAGYSPICPVLFLPTFLKDEIPQEHKDGLDMDVYKRQV